MAIYGYIWLYTPENMYCGCLDMYLWCLDLYFKCLGLYVWCLDLFFGCPDLYLGVWTYRSSKPPDSVHHWHCPFK